MILRFLALGALLLATSGSPRAEGTRLDPLALEIVQREIGAPLNTRHAAHLRLRATAANPVEAVWRIGNLHLRPARGRPWPDHAGRQRYRVRDCAAPRLAQARKIPVVAVHLPEATPARAVRADRAGTRRLTLILGRGTLLAVQAVPADEGHAFAESVLLDAELWSELLRDGPDGPVPLPGREPEGTLASLVPQEEPRTVQIEGRILGLGAAACPRLISLRASTLRGRSLAARECRLVPVRGSC